MRVLIAPDKFKGTLKASKAAQAIDTGVKLFDSSIETLLLPLADGGEGTLDIIEHKLKCNRVYSLVNDPVGKIIESYYLLNEEEAFIELAQTSGLELLAVKDRNPMYTGSFGTGQLILNAIQKGAKTINLFVGGSATNDAGIGIAAALGFEFLDKSGRVVNPIGINLVNIVKIHSSKLKYDPKSIGFTVFCDVDNKLYGENGAAKIFAKQKGASQKDIVHLDKGLKHISGIISKYFEVKIDNVRGGGAAGGIAAGLYGMLDAKIKSGIDKILKLVEFEKYLKLSDLVITGEGKLDDSSFNGKVVGEVLKHCVNHKKDVGILIGDKDPDIKEKLPANLLGVKTILEYAKDKNDAFENPTFYLEKMAYDLVESL